MERVTCHNPENGFYVLRLRARGLRDLGTLVGHTATISAGEWVQVSGTWANDRAHELQFRAQFLRSAAPTTAEGIEKYLDSGTIRGVGPVYARKLVAAFGEAVFDVVEQELDRLREVPGVGPVRASHIAAGWAEQKVVREIMLVLHSHGVCTKGRCGFKGRTRHRRCRPSPRTPTGLRATSAASASARRTRSRSGWASSAPP